MQRLQEILANLGNWQLTLELLSYDFTIKALIAAALMGLISGVIGPLIVTRQMSFSVHGSSELALTGAAAALLFGFNVGGGAIIGSVVAALLFGLLGTSRSERDSVIGVLMAFGLGLSVLFIHLYPGRSSTAFALLTGQVVGISDQGLTQLAIVVVIILGAVALLWKPLLFAGADPLVAQARGVNLRWMSIIFAVLVGLTAAQGVQIVGALLVLSLLITPGAAAVLVTANPAKAVVLAVIFAEIAAVGGVLLSLAPGVPVSVFVTALSFTIYLLARGYSTLVRAGS